MRRLTPNEKARLRVSTGLAFDTIAKCERGERVQEVSRLRFERGLRDERIDLADESEAKAS